jgi:hypothetical protein
MNVSRSKYGLPPKSDGNSQIDQTAPTDMNTSSGSGAVLAICGVAVLLVGAVAGYIFWRRKAEQPHS